MHAIRVEHLTQRYGETNALFRHEPQYCWARELSSIWVLGLGDRAVPVPGRARPRWIGEDVGNYGGMLDGGDDLQGATVLRASMSISNTRLSNRAQLMGTGAKGGHLTVVC
jgi:hypothetical protein